MTPVTAIVITKNEERNISDCLESLRWADEIIVVDAESRDKTAELAKTFTPNVFIQPWLGFAAAKSFAASRAKHPWILWVDADERVLPELAAEIDELIKTDPSEAAFSVARRAYFLGRWIRHSGWYPGRVPRLFHASRARFNTASVHEGLEISGTTGMLKNDLLHFTDPNIFHYLSKLNKYTSLATEDLRKKKKRFAISDLFIRPFWQFFRMYVLRRGFLDGTQGVLLALFSAMYVFTKYAKLWDTTRVEGMKQ